jgi:hypothetical protein
MSQNANTFEDVTIVHQGSVGRLNLVPKLKQTLQALVLTEILQFERQNTTRKLILNKKGRTIRNVGDEGWSEKDYIYSTRALTAQITYFQFKVNLGPKRHLWCNRWHRRP